MSLLAAAWGVGGVVFGADSLVWVAQSEKGEIYSEAANAIRDELVQDARRSVVIAAPARDLALGVVPPQIVVTLGVSALRAMVERVQSEPGLARVPVLAALLPKTSYDALMPKPLVGWSAAFLDQPVDRYLELLRQAMPARRRVGVLLGPDSAALKTSLQRGTNARGQQLVAVTVDGSDSDLYASLRQVLVEADVLLLLPENQWLGPSGLQNVLITAYRQHVPVVTYSPAHVKAGATLALYSTPTQAARQAALAVRGLLAGKSLPPPRLAEHFTVIANQQVSRSLGIALDDAGFLTDAVRKQEDLR